MTHPSSSALRQRFRPLFWLGACFLAIAFIVRLVLLIWAGHAVPPNPLSWLYIFGMGLIYDLITFVYVAWPLVLYLWLMPTRAYRSRPNQWVAYVIGLALLYGLMFIAVSEWVFWGEFSTRFNFIAVDYLVYTTEVIGNIEQSYPIGLWMTLIGLVAIVVTWLTRRGLNVRDDGSTIGKRSLWVLGWLALTVLTAFAFNSEAKNRSTNAYVNTLAGNGIYEFFAAFRNSHLDYAHFYKSLPEDQAFSELRHMLKTPDATYVSNDIHDITRAIHHDGPEKHLNVVLISVESLSGEYLKTFGNTENLTPNLDALVGQSLFFDRLYANGTRTVRGLEALALSVPPTPGDSIVKQRNNEHLFSLADVFNARGYESKFVYGGYGYFDNMNYFFGNNGYTAVDRRDIPKTSTIHSENVWGVADEDLFTLSLQQMDQAHADGKPFFLHIMTTSNHRPYTFPAGRIDGAQGQRTSAVKYTDWAIADFIKRARSKPYFDDTVFVITADHCASSAGRSSVPVNRYHIPLWIYAPKYIQPQRVDRLMSQIDIAPTLLGLLNFSYHSRFFGYDLFALEPGRERAFPSTYENLGYLKGDRLTVLSPKQKVEQLHPDVDTGDATPVAHVDENEVRQAIAAYQTASFMFKHGAMKNAAYPASEQP